MEHLDYPEINNADETEEKIKNIDEENKNIYKQNSIKNYSKIIENNKINSSKLSIEEPNTDKNQEIICGENIKSNDDSKKNLNEGVINNDDNVLISELSKK